jgi:hypothetical protein
MAISFQASGILALPDHTQGHYGDRLSDAELEVADLVPLDVKA